ncbi:N-acetylglutamate kinase [Belliella buryatensis]|uniref:Acetylglutamate kinase n=1 Tax=Belliella buryatensis TaxID=1500549 RepID=A0A239FN72_9BACT|nr:acetylglutamate kinase [Belliella buryatensis]SNS58329.1 N-acetylglutamate kinase [Belliella buryatensis]
MHSSKLLIKYGGNAMVNQKIKSQIATALHHLRKAGHQIVLVHGGGPFINQALNQAGIHSEFVEGQRKTSPEAMEVVQRTLIGEVNADLVSLFSRHHLQAVGLSGFDANLVNVSAKKLQITHPNGELDHLDLGRVGEIETVNPTLIKSLVRDGFMPVIACVGSDAEGISYNINADDFAGEIAAAIKADYYISLTDVDGLYENYPDPKSILSEIALEQLPSLYGSIIQGGMIPKVQSCENALKKGVKNALILNGTEPEQLLAFFEKNQVLGTTITH